MNPRAILWERGGCVPNAVGVPSLGFVNRQEPMKTKVSICGTDPFLPRCQDLIFSLVFGLVVLGLPAAESAENQSEPIHNGKPLSYWVDVLGRPSVSSTLFPKPKEIEGGLEAQDALEHIGTNSIPFLIEWIGREPASSAANPKGSAADLSAQSATREAADGAWSSFRAEGTVQAFSILGPAARSAIPGLARLVTNQFGSSEHRLAIDQRAVLPPCAWLVLPALGAIGPESLPVLLTIVTNQTATPATRVTALQAVNVMGASALAALPVLLRCVEDSDEMVAETALGSVSIVGKRDQRVFVALTNALRSSARGVRFSAVEGLRPFGDQALPVLVYALNDTNPGIRYIALTTLIRAAPQALTNVTVLAIFAEGLRSADPGTRDWAAQALRAAGQQARSEYPDLEVPRRDIELIRREATNTLRHLAPELLLSSPR